MKQKQKSFSAVLLALLTVLMCALWWGCGAEEKEMQPDGSGTQTEETQPEDGTDSEDISDVQVVMTLADSVNFLRALQPQSLGLTGDSMGAYEIYAADEMVPVDGFSCAKLSVYQRSEGSQTNTIRGIYLLMRDGSRIYRLEPENGSVTELTYTGGDPRS